jgi:hypothetical protein
VGLDKIELEGVVSVLFMLLNTSFFSKSFLFTSFGGFYMYLGNDVKYP